MPGEDFAASRTEFLRNHSKGGYTFSMKTAISIPDSVYTEAERLAQHLGKSRSQLYSEAVAEYVARHDTEILTEAMDKVCDAVDTHLDPAFSSVTRRVLEQSEW